MLGILGKRRSFEYNEIDIMAAGQKQWKDLYEFDTPVVRILKLSSIHIVNAPICTGPCSARFPYILEAKHRYGSSETYAPLHRGRGRASD